MSDTQLPSTTPRRSFIGRITLGAAALLAGRAASLHARRGRASRLAR